MKTSLSPWLADLLALLSGALLTLAFAPFDFSYLAIVLPALLLWLCGEAKPRRAAWRGALFGLGLYSTGIYWIYISLHDYGNAPAAFAVLATLVVVLLMALYPALFAYLLVRWAPRSGLYRWLLVAPALWAGLEWVRSWLFTGFPWLSLGYSQIDSPLAGIAPWLGVFGVGWAVMLCAGAVVSLFAGRNGRARVSGGVLLVLLWGMALISGHIQWAEPAADKPIRVALVQGNIPQDQKFREGGIAQALRQYVEVSWKHDSDNDLIIWPETAIPVFYDDLPEDFLTDLNERAQRSDTDYLTGVPMGSWETRTFYNAVVSLGSSHGFYRKRRLLPFGEYVPLRFVLNFFHGFVDIPMADFTPGEREQPLLRVAGQPVGVSICFEAAFGSEIRLALPEAGFLVNVSNDAWFGYSLAPYQHLQIVRMRALEVGRYIARATNTGISAFIDERGEVVAHSELFTDQVLTGSVQPLRGITPYARIGDAGMILLTGILLIAGPLLRWRLTRLNTVQDTGDD